LAFLIEPLLLDRRANANDLISFADILSKLMSARAGKAVADNHSPHDQKLDSAIRRQNARGA
jgi:hypothetical protein